MRRPPVLAVLFCLLVAAFGWTLRLPSARAEDPPAHPHGGLDRDCAQCHTAEGWHPLRKPLPFQHAETGFPLRYAHGQTSCRGCHKTLTFNHVATACADCHRDAHRGELGTQCETCHVEQSWTNRGEMLRVHQRTSFPLLGAHANKDCVACHRSSAPREFTRTPTTCAECHLADFRAAREPDHQGLGFPRRCEDCHSASSARWQEGVFSGSFPHPAAFPLVGAHSALGCQECHAAGFTGTSRECVACHRAAFDRTTDPNHRASGFPTSCQPCHSTAAWRPSTFEHERLFPIRSGRHSGIDCAGCHVSPGNFRAFECIRCHEHPRDEMDDEHRRVSGYAYSSPACYRCHPRGTE